MEIIDYIVCDDIRQELANKVTLVGIYADTINVETPDPSAIKWPLQMKLGFFVRVAISEADLASVGSKFQAVVKLEQSELLRLEGDFEIKEPGKKILSLPMAAIVAIPAPGLIDFTLRFTGKDERFVHELKPSLQVRVALRRKQ